MVPVEPFLGRVLGLRGPGCRYAVLGPTTPAGAWQLDSIPCLCWDVDGTSSNPRRCGSLPKRDLGKDEGILGIYQVQCRQWPLLG